MGAFPDRSAEYGSPGTLEWLVRTCQSSAMKNAAAALAVALVLLAAGCSSAGDEPEAKPAPTASSTAPDPQDGVHCLPVAASTAQRIAAGEKKGVHLIPGRAVAVKAP